MIRTEVVDRANQIHPVIRGCFASEGSPLACQGATSSHQSGQTSTEGGLQPFDEGGVDQPASWRPLQHLLHLGGCTLHQATDDADHAPTRILLHHLGDQRRWSSPHPVPRPQQGSSSPATGQRFAKDLLHGSLSRRKVHVGFEAIATEQQRTAQGAATHLLQQRDDQGEVALLPQGSTQPQASAHLQRHRQPEDGALYLDPQFIQLHLTQIAWELLPVPPAEVLSRYELRCSTPPYIAAKDAHVLAAAVEGAAQFLLSLDRRQCSSLPHVLAAAPAVKQMGLSGGVLHR